jgi:hypothetical protein
MRKPDHSGKAERSSEPELNFGVTRMRVTSGSVASEDLW